MRFRLTLLAAALLVLAVAAPGATAQQRIVGGTPAGAGEFPFMAALVYTGEEPDAGQFCGAQVIGPTTVLTAGHCIADLTAADFYVILGTNALSEAGAANRRQVKGIATRPDFDFETLFEDVGIVELTAPAGAPPIAIANPAVPAEAAAFQPNDPATVLGWGFTSDPEVDPDATVPDDLQKAGVKIFSDAFCGALYGEQPFFRPGDVVCAGIPGTYDKDACYGDSGGPLFVTVAGQRKLVGTVSTGLGCAQADAPGTYAEVTSPALRAFITGYANGVGPLAPANGKPSVTPGGIVRPGQTLSCNPGSWGERATGLSFEYEWGQALGDFGLSPIPGATGASFKVRDADVFTRLACFVTARNSAGVGGAQSGSVAVGEPRDAPPATPPAARPDTVAPRVRLLARQCARRRCRLIVNVSDSEPSAGIRRVTTTVFSRVATRCRVRRPGRRCSETVRRAYRAKRVEGTVYSMTTRKLPRGSQRVVFGVSDNAGNRRLRALTTRFRLR